MGYSNKNLNDWIKVYTFYFQELEGQKSEFLLQSLIPRIIKLALSLPDKIKIPIPILKASEYVYLIILINHHFFYKTAW